MTLSESLSLVTSSAIHAKFGRASDDFQPYTPHPFSVREPISAENDCWERKFDLTITSFGSKAPRNAEEFVTVWKSPRIALTMKPEAHSATTEPLAHYSLSRYSPGTSFCGTSCVLTSFWSMSPACSTPATASASNAFPSSINSDTLSESAPSMFDNPCKSPDCAPDVSLRASGANASVSTLWPRPRVLSAVGVLAPIVFRPRAFVFTAFFFKAGFFFANFFLEVPLFLTRFFLTVFFSGFPFFPADPLGFVSFFLVLFLAMRAVYHRHVPAHETELDVQRGNPRDW